MNVEDLTKIDVGFYENMTNDVYHKSSGVSKSVLDMSVVDLYKPEWSRVCPIDSDKIKTFNFGDAMHAICLEPHRLKADFTVMPDFNLRTNSGKQEKKEFEEYHKDFKILTDKEHKKLCLMYESVMSHPKARALIEADGIAEGSYFWKDDETGLLCKCRPDKNLSNGLLVDIKTTPDIKTFNQSVDDYRYYVQDPWYCDGVKRFECEQRMEFLVIQKNIELGRYPVEVISLPSEVIEYGRDVYRDNLNQYAEFLEQKKEPKTKELEMSFRFYQKSNEYYGDAI